MFLSFFLIFNSHTENLIYFFNLRKSPYFSCREKKFVLLRKKFALPDARFCHGQGKIVKIHLNFFFIDFFVFFIFQLSISLESKLIIELYFLFLFFNGYFVNLFIFNFYIFYLHLNYQKNIRSFEKILVLSLSFFASKVAFPNLLLFYGLITCTFLFLNYL